MKSHLLLTTIAAVVLVGCGNPEADRALIEATATGSVEAIKKAITDGADVNAKDVDGQTPLDMAVEWRETKTADLLRKHGGKTGEELKAEGK